MFGKGINSDSACSCFLSSYYDVIKADSNEVKLFINGDIHLIEEPERSDIKALFQTCVEKNVTDSSAKMNLTDEMKKKMKSKWVALFSLTSVRDSVDLNKFCDCIVDSLNDRITIREYLGMDTEKNSQYEILIENCKQKNRKNGK
jgi:hypothetical protein